MKICFVPNDVGAPGYYRCLFPMEQLAKHGHEAKLPPHTMDGDFLNIGLMNLREQRNMFGETTREYVQIPDADVFVLQMPQQEIIPGFTLRARALGRIVVGETDDDWINLTPDHPAYYGSNKRPDYNRFHMLKTFRACNALTVSTPHLKEVYEQLNPNVHVLPNVLNWEMWEQVTPQYELERERVRIGWMGNSKLRPRDVALLGEFVGDFLRDHPEVDFVLSGNNPGVHDQLGIEKAQRVTYPQLPFARRPDFKHYDLPMITAVMDIGLVPLVLSPFNQGKSALKGMEYAACGIPCVASPTEPYKEWVEPGKNGFLASNPNEWREALEKLLDPTTRRRMGAEARAKAKRHTIQKHWKQWANFYLSLKLSAAPYIPGRPNNFSSLLTSSGSAAKTVAAA